MTTIDGHTKGAVGRLVPMVLLLALAAVLPSWTAAQVAPDTAAGTYPTTITIPVPEPGVVYLRNGPPGGVRIRSRHVRGHRIAAEPPSSANAPATARDAAAPDLARLDALLRRLGPSERLEVVPTPTGPVVVILADRPGQRRPDTLHVEPLAAAFAAPPAVVRSPVAARPLPRAALARLADEVEQSLLQTGLFRSLFVHFAFDSATLLPTAFATLDAVVEVLARHQDLRIEIAGHTDAVGPGAYNRRLSEARAEAVRRYLVREGALVPDRVRAAGYGETRPLLGNDTPTGRALNRRVEFVLLEPTSAAAPTAADREAAADSLRRAVEAAVRDAFAPSPRADTLR